MASFDIHNLDDLLAQLKGCFEAATAIGLADTAAAITAAIETADLEVAALAVAAEGDEA